MNEDRQPYFLWVRSLSGPQPQVVYGDSKGPYLDESNRGKVIGEPRKMQKVSFMPDLDYLAEQYPCREEA